MTWYNICNAWLIQPDEQNYPKILEKMASQCSLGTVPFLYNQQCLDFLAQLIDMKFGLNTIFIVNSLPEFFVNCTLSIKKLNDVCYRSLNFFFFQYMKSDLEIEMNFIAKININLDRNVS